MNVYIQIHIFRDVLGCELPPDSPQNIIRQIQAHVCTYHIYAEPNRHIYAEPKRAQFWAEKTCS